ncbi:MAG: hypothetical protein KJO55_04960 [Gammaproteobacteria bacterium]|nr:hypothetical protein [Gammaproteobacteria bacterium]
MLALGTHLAYLAISIALTIWVAHTLSTNGLPFLVDSFHGNATLARSVNHLLVVGFYLVNLGYVTLTIRRGGYPANLTEAIEILSTRVGWVLLVLGALHLFNMYILNRWRRSAFYDREHAETELARRKTIRAEAGL